MSILSIYGDNNKLTYSFQSNVASILAAPGLYWYCDVSLQTTTVMDTYLLLRKGFSCMAVGGGGPSVLWH